MTTKYQIASQIFTNLTSNLTEDTAQSKLCSRIKSFILSESQSGSVMSNMAFAINFVSGAGDIREESITPLFERYVKLTEFVKEHSLRFPLEESLIEEVIKLQEDDGAGVSGSGAGSVAAPLGPVATNNTSGVAKLDYPIGEKPVKRKKEDAIDSPTS